MSEEHDQRELKMRCIETAARTPFSNADHMLATAQAWFEWVIAPPAPPRGHTSAARSRMEAQKKK